MVYLPAPRKTDRHLQSKLAKNSSPRSRKWHPKAAMLLPFESTKRRIRRIAKYVDFVIHRKGWKRNGRKRKSRTQSRKDRKRQTMRGLMNMLVTSDWKWNLQEYTRPITNLWRDRRTFPDHEEPAEMQDPSFSKSEDCIKGHFLVSI